MNSLDGDLSYIQSIQAVDHLHCQASHVLLRTSSHSMAKKQSSNGLGQKSGSVQYLRHAGGRGGPSFFL